MTATVGSQAARMARVPREWRFEATPPRRSRSLLAGRQDTYNVSIQIRCTGERVHFVVDGEAVASTRRIALCDWIRHQGAKAPYADGRLALTDTGRDVWFELEDAVAPTLLVAGAVRTILALLSD